MRKTTVMICCVDAVDLNGGYHTACKMHMRPTHFRHSLKSGTPEFKTYLLMKRYEQAGRIVFAWESLGLLPLLKDLMLPSARLVGEAGPRL
jgi:hypothetical protein